MTMGSRLAISLVLTMLSPFCRGEVNIFLNQKPVFQVVLAKENVTIYCLATLPQEYTDTKIVIYRTGDTLVNDTPYKKVNTPPVQNTTEISYQFYIQPIHDRNIQGNFYYCSTTGASRRVIGSGTFIHVRDTGYRVSPDGSWSKLKVFLITSCCILAVLSLAGTILLLLWKKKGYPIWSPVKAHSENGNQTGAIMSSSNGPEASMSGSIYTTLQRHSIDVYDTIEQDIKNQLQDSKRVPSIPKQKPEIKKKPEKLSVGKKKAADMGMQPAAAHGAICETVYENL